MMDFILLFCGAGACTLILFIVYVYLHFRSNKKRKLGTLIAAGGIFALIVFCIFLPSLCLKYELYEDKIRDLFSLILNNKGEEKTFDFNIEYDPIEKEALSKKTEARVEYSSPYIDPMNLYILGKNHADEEQRELSQTFYDQAQKIFLKEGNLGGVAFCFLRMGENEWILNNLSKAELFYQKAFDIFEKEPNKLGEAYALRALARINSRTGKRKKAEVYYQDSLKIFQGLKFDWGAATIFLGLADGSLDLGRLEEASHLYKQALNLYQKEGDKKQIAYSLKGLGMTERKLGNYEKSKAYLKRAFELFKERKDLRGEGKVLNAFGNLDFTFGNIESASSYYGRAFEIFKKFNSIRWMAFVLKDMSDLEIQRGQYQKAEDLLNQASSLIKKIDETNNIERRLLISQGDLETHRGHYEKADAYYNKVLKMNEEMGDRHRMARTIENFAYLKQKKGDFKEAEDFLNQALDLFMKSGDQKSVANIYLKKGKIEWLHGQYAKSIEAYTHAKNISHEINYLDMELQASFGIGSCLFFMGDTQKANDIFLETTQKLNKIMIPLVKAQILQELGLFKYYTSEYEDALEYTEKSQEIYESLDNNEGVSAVISLMGNIERKRGNFSKAKELFRKAYEKSEGTNFFAEAYALRGFGDIAFVEGQSKDALKFYEKSLEIFTSLNCSLGKSSVYRRLGEVKLVLDDKNKALIYFNKALDISTKIENSSETATTFLGLGKLEKDKKNYGQSLAYYKKAKDIFTNIGLMCGIVKANYGIGTLVNHGVNQDAAKESLNQSILIAQNINDNITAGEAFLELCKIDKALGKFGSARVSCGKALKLFTKSNHLLGETKARLASADLENLSDHNVETITAYEKCLEVSKKIENPEYEVKSLLGLATVAFYQENFEESRQLYKKILNIIKNKDAFLHKKIKVWLKLGELEGSLGNFDLARTYYKNAFAIATEIECVPYQISILRHQGRSETKAKNFSDALLFYNKSLALSQLMERQQDVAKIFYNMGSLYLKVNDPSEALNYFIKAQKLFKQDDAWRDALAWRGIGKAQMQLGRFEEARQAYDRAISLFRESHLEICETKQYIWMLETKHNFKKNETLSFDDVKSCFKECSSKRRYAKFLEKAACVETEELSEEKRIEILKEGLEIFKRLGDKEKTKSTLIKLQKFS